ncbi:hypothetical protein RFI_37583 [Reticulomyxa filosa]|uniref:Uncharacterized protein n=1 Tax=Reticulomyxa filosa TaxID=46433 RepID=X6LEY0_RETFI|nr:hypothetical protein RFI_37583 [Reticulomyxa filosa]|eukprot:ETN99885.1 hypothetical protein RFI_37583 [Reticulomyxa filosa]
MDKLNKKKIKMVNKELYHVQELKQFHKMPIVKVMLFNSDDIHFKQCRKCYILNHIDRECPKKRKLCKYCVLANHAQRNAETKTTQANTNVFYVVINIQAIHCNVNCILKEEIKTKILKKEFFFYSDKKSFLLVENFHILILRFCARSDIYKITNEIPKVNSRNKIIITRKNVEQKNGNSSNIHMIFFNNKCLNLFFVLVCFNLLKELN